jgi:hypothetical protein
VGVVATRQQPDFVCRSMQLTPGASRLSGVLSKMRETQCVSLWLWPSPRQRLLVLEAVSGTTRRPSLHSRHRPSNSQPSLFPAAVAYRCGSSQSRSGPPGRAPTRYPTQVISQPEQDSITGNAC